MVDFTRGETEKHAIQSKLSQTALMDTKE